MKEVEKKDAPEVSGGYTPTDAGWLPILQEPQPGFPPNPCGPTDCPDPLGDALRKNQIQS